MADHVLARPRKTSAGADGLILLADEVGFLMNACVKRTWAPVGKTPVVPFRNRCHRKVSVLGAVVLRPRTGDLSLLFDCHPDSYVRGPQAAAFLHRALAEFPGRRLDVVWDGLWAHRSVIVKEVVADHPRLQLHPLPAYAPDLNPQEGVWCLTKYHRTANHSIGDLPTLHATAAKHLTEVGDSPDLLRACFAEAGLITTCAITT